MASEVDIALKNREIFSVEELSFHDARGFRVFLRLINLFAPYREQRPLLVRIFAINNLHACSHFITSYWVII